ncbi:MAG TPA: acyl carrier protein phosphodiesterase [Hymenobacter sp.]|uniref:acyl carrier protein phosphodiesterase n=1 Tax=Hymenobacter sp. TaxID=1898978 RepID=UPI002D7EC12E|nr:acyl carrier protein phosphodiesterase [Hymenobacter sp.]HET9503264.1 acyl carrier protein phosphodiesterase [Hymenobacter sp.]
MNFLAHLLLAGPDATAPPYAGHLLGQFIADSVPGRQLERYPAEVQVGIRAHRAIDTFTDQHPVVRRSTARLRAAGTGKYAGVVADVFYDHFLAANFSEFSTESLPAFTQRVYSVLAGRAAEFPAPVQRFFPYLVQQNWLLGYAEIAGIERALQGLSRRASPGSGMEMAGAELRHNYAAYEADFRAFFPELQAFTEQ